MRTRYFLLPKCIVAAAVVLATGARPLAAGDAFRQNARLGRGVNLLGWDVIWQNPARTQFKEAHFKRIREAGFNHVRINLHPLRDGKPDTSGKLRPEFFQTMDWAVDHALTNGLMVIPYFYEAQQSGHLSPNNRATPRNSCAETT
jgi:endoglucanase